MKFGEFKPRSAFLKLQDGENKVRFVSEAEEFNSVYEGRASQRFVAYVIDRTDGEVKSFTFGATIMKSISALANSQEYGFPDLPPYDVIIIRKGTGKETEYTVNAARKDTALTEIELKMISEQKSIKELSTKLNQTEPKQGIENTNQPPIEEYDKDDIEVKDIPF
jgi:hypothetical protein